MSQTAPKGDVGLSLLQGDLLQWQFRVFEAIRRQVSQWLAKPIKTEEDQERNRALLRIATELDQMAIVMSRRMIMAFLHHLTAFDGASYTVTWDSVRAAAAVLVQRNPIDAAFPEFRTGVIEPLGESRAKTLMSHVTATMVEGAFFVQPQIFALQDVVGRVHRFSIRRTQDGYEIVRQRLRRSRM